MPKLRIVELTTKEIAVYDTDNGELIVIPEKGKDEWLNVKDSIEAARKISDKFGGMSLTKQQLKSLLLATDRAVLLT